MIHDMKHVESLQMTMKQFYAVKNARRAILSHDGHSDEYEYKRFEVQLLDWGAVQIISEVGRKGDEGTAASIFARARRQIFVGKRGGLTLCNPARFIGKGCSIKRVPTKGWVKGRQAVWHPTI